MYLLTNGNELDINNIFDLKIWLNKKFNSVAFPLIGAGTGGIKKELVIKFMSEEISKSDFKVKVIFVEYIRKVY